MGIKLGRLGEVHIDILNESSPIFRPNFRTNRLSLVSCTSLFIFLLPKNLEKEHRPGGWHEPDIDAEAHIDTSRQGQGRLRRCTGDRVFFLSSFVVFSASLCYWLFLSPSFFFCLNIRPSKICAHRRSLTEPGRQYPILSRCLSPKSGPWFSVSAQPQVSRRGGTGIEERLHTDQRATMQGQVVS